MQNDSEKKRPTVSDSCLEEDDQISSPDDTLVKKIEEAITHKPQEQVLRSALETVLHEASTDQRAFLFVRDICLVSLADAVEDDVIDKEPRVSVDLTNSEKRQHLTITSSKFRPESCLLSPHKLQSSEYTSTKSPNEKLRFLMPGSVEKEKAGQ